MSSLDSTSPKLQEFASIILKLRTKEEISSFFKDLLSNSELEELLKRWEIAKMLGDKKSYAEIERLTGASSATIAKVKDSLKYGFGGINTAIDRIK